MRKHGTLPACFYDLDKEAEKIAGNSLRTLRSKGITLTVADASVAGIAISNDLTLLTDNAKHYPQREIKTEPA